MTRSNRTIRCPQPSFDIVPFRRSVTRICLKSGGAGPIPKDMKTLPVKDSACSRLATFPLFADVSVEALEQLADLVQQRRFPKGALVLARENNDAALHLLVHGRVKLVLTSTEGREIVLSHLQAPAHFGEDSLVAGGAAAGAVVALTEVETLALDRRSLADAIRMEPQLALSLIGGLASRLRTTVSRLEDLAFNDATHRVMRVVMNVATAALETRGAPVIQGMTHYDIATLAGTSRETASRVLSSLAQTGVVSTAGRTIIVDLERLADRLHTHQH